MGKRAEIGDGPGRKAVNDEAVNDAITRAAKGGGIRRHRRRAESNGKVRSWRGDLGGKFFSFSGFPRGPLVVLARERSANKSEVEETDEGRSLKWSS